MSGNVVGSEDVVVFDIDRRKLAAALARILDVDATTAALISPAAYLLGEHLVASGNGFPVVLWVPQLFGPVPSAALQVLPDPATPVVLLVPTRQALPAELVDALKVRGGIGVVLLETVGADDRER